jgi:hypothetical protein
MKTTTVVILVIIAFAVMCSMFYPKVSQFLVLNEPDETQDVPPTWNLDWSGGPGYDRFRILNEEGPYNMN